MKKAMTRGKQGRSESAATAFRRHDVSGPAIDDRFRVRPRACLGVKSRRRIDEMNTRMRWIAPIGLSLMLPWGPKPAGADDAQTRSPAWSEALQRSDGRRLGGKLIGDPAAGFQFQVEGSRTPVRLETGSVVVFEGQGPAPSDGFPPFRVELGLGQRISGRLGVVDQDAVHLVDSSAGKALTVSRSGVRAVVQRLGEMQVLEDGFDAIDGKRWTLIGNPEVVDDPRIAGDHSLKIPADGTSLTCRLSEAVGSGRLEVAFHDTGLVATGHQWFVDLLFRGPTGMETVRAVLGWSDESLSVESPGGPALAVQRLTRKAGWHRLSLRFGPGQTEVAVDGNDLAHGKGPGGPLVEIRLASYKSGKTAAPDGLAGYLDDLRLVRFAEPVAGLEIDPTQDEVRLAGGDQLFGTIQSADGARIRLSVDEQEVTLPWSEVSGLDFKRVSNPGQPIEGLLVRVDWRAAPGNEPHDLDQADGALASLSDATLTLSTPYAGTLTIARDRLRRLQVLGRGRRVVIDATAHHLGDEIVGSPLPLDPPQPEGGTLERSFGLTEVPAGPSFLTFDVVQVAGEASFLPFSDLVKNGEIRTNLLLNGKPLDYLNRHITTKNETAERIRVSIPDGLLQKGKNTLRLEQTGKADDPTQLDDLGVLEIGFESGERLPASSKP